MKTYTVHFNVVVSFNRTILTLGHEGNTALLHRVTHPPKNFLGSIGQYSTVEIFKRVTHPPKNFLGFHRTIQPSGDILIIWTVQPSDHQGQYSALAQ
jgi:hypothetical protein